jgi:3-oxoacyl-[acyl-carrier-protein] synthase-3
MIELGQIEAGLVVAGEIGLQLLESTIAKLLANKDALTRKSIKPSFASLTIGSGAAAVLVARSDLASESGGASHALLGGVIRAATEHSGLCRGGAAGGSDTGVGASSELDMATDAEALLDAGVALAKTTFGEFLGSLDWTKDQIGRVITHQVGRAHHKALLEALGLAEDRAYVTFDRLGNVGSVSVPISLALAEEAGFVAGGHTLALLGIGSGLSSIMLGVRW